MSFSLSYFSPIDNVCKIVGSRVRYKPQTAYALSDIGKRIKKSGYGIPKDNKISLILSMAKRVTKYIKNKFYVI